MGKQINFYQTEGDMCEFEAYVHQLSLDSFLATGPVGSDLHTDHFTFGELYYLTNEKEQIHTKTSEYCTYISSSKNPVIEFSSCRIQKEYGENYYLNGRIYYFNEQCENESLFAYYKQLVKFIKKNYFYSKTTGFYCGKDFLEEYNKKEVFACNPRPLDLF